MIFISHIRSTGTCDSLFFDCFWGRGGNLAKIGNPIVFKKSWVTSLEGPNHKKGKVLKKSVQISALSLEYVKKNLIIKLNTIRKEFRWKNSTILAAKIVEMY